MRRFAVCTAALAAFAAFASAAPAEPSGSKILSVTHPSGNPGLIDVLIDDVEYDVRSGTVAVTATVACNAPSVFVLFVDYEAGQSRGSTTQTGLTTTDANACDEPVRAVIEPVSGERFKPGKATIEISASACGRSCTVEVVRAEILLIPER